MQRVNEDLRREMIAKAAYFRAEQRGFDGGDPVADWLLAEAAVDAELGLDDDRTDDLEEKLAAVTEKLTAFRRKLARAKAETRKEWEADVEKLTRLRDRFEKRIGTVRAQGAEASTTARQRVAKTWDDISELLSRLSRKKTRSS